MKTHVIRAKFRCDSSSKHMGYRPDENGKPGYGIVTGFKFSPVTSNDPTSENGQFWAATPQGSINIDTTKLDPETFEIGKLYYVDFHLADTVQE